MTKSNLPDKTDPTSEAVAKWMLEELEKQGGILYQEDAASQIEDLFGEAFVYQNDLGNTAIHKHVLTAFRKLTGDSIVWSRAERLWRKREAGDEPTRRQD